MRRWGPGAIVVALLAATAIAFATTERQKLEKTPFAVIHITKQFSPTRRAATIVLKLRHPHLLTVQMVDSRDRVVATLAVERRFGPGRVSLRWQGRIPDGVYEPRIVLDTGRVFQTSYLVWPLDAILVAVLLANAEDERARARTDVAGEIDSRELKAVATGP